MKNQKHGNSLGLAITLCAGLLVLAIAGCSGQQTPAASGESPAGNQVAMSFDLNACQQLGPSLYQCPGSDKPICDPGYNKGDIECVRVDKSGVLVRQGM